MAAGTAHCGRPHGHTLSEIHNYVYIYLYIHDTHTYIIVIHTHTHTHACNIEELYIGSYSVHDLE